MILFLIKKTFFDFWDNLIAIIILNLGFILISFFEIFSFTILIKLGIFLFSKNQVLLLYFFSYILIIVEGIILFIYMGAVSRFLKEIADYKSPGFKDFFIYLKETYKSSTIFAIILSTFLVIFIISARYYLIYNPQIGGMKIGIIFFVILFWFTFITLLASQFFFPLQSNFDKKVKKNIKKMFLLFFDNTGFSIILFIVNIIIFLLSLLTLFLFFGIAVNLLWMVVAFKLRLYKYDYLEKNPGTKNKNIPWDELLAYDKETIGTRTLRSMIFPWKY